MINARGEKIMDGKTTVMDYLNRSLDKIDIRATMTAGLGMHLVEPLPSNGIYFYRKEKEFDFLNPISIDEIRRLVKENEHTLDPGAVNAILQFSEELTSDINEGAGYIPMTQYDAVAQYLGVDI